MEDAIYHACRLAFVCGQDGVPWHFMVRLLRQGINSEHEPQELRPEVFKKYPILLELREKMLSVVNGTGGTAK